MLCASLHSVIVCSLTSHLTISFDHGDSITSNFLHLSTLAHCCLLSHNLRFEKLNPEPDGHQTSSEMGRLLREHQRATQALNNATVREVHDSMRSQIMQLVSLNSYKLCDPRLTDIDRALSSTLRCPNSKKIKRVAQWENRPEDLRLHADLEFSFRSEVLTFHVCI